MLTAPKGYEYWQYDEDDKLIIDPEAPEWAKKEFNDYMNQFNEAEKSGKENNIIRNA